MEPRTPNERPMNANEGESFIWGGGSSPRPSPLYGFSVPCAVAQSCTLLYRRFAIGSAPASSRSLELVGRLRNAIPRYGRLQICATLRRCSSLRRGSIDCRISIYRAPRVTPSTVCLFPLSLRERDRVRGKAAFEFHDTAIEDGEEPVRQTLEYLPSWQSFG